MSHVLDGLGQTRVTLGNRLAEPADDVTTDDVAGGEEGHGVLLEDPHGVEVDVVAHGDLAERRGEERLVLEELAAVVGDLRGDAAVVVIADEPRLGKRALGTRGPADEAVADGAVLVGCQVDLGVVGHELLGASYR